MAPVHVCGAHVRLTCSGKYAVCVCLPRRLMLHNVKTANGNEKTKSECIAMQHQSTLDASCSGSPLSNRQCLPNFVIDRFFFWRANNSHDEVIVGLNCYWVGKNIVRLNIDTDSLAPTEIVEECARIILRRVFVRIKNSESCERPLAETEVGGSATKNMFMKQWLGKIIWPEK